MKSCQIIPPGALVAGLCLIWGSAQAETVIYKELEREMVVGRGFSTADRSQSFIVYDTATQRLLVWIRFSSSHDFKYYSINTNLSDFNVTRGVSGSKGNETVFFRANTSTNSSGRFFAYAFFARGRDTTLDLGNGSTADLPKTMKATSRGVDDLLGAPYVFESVSTWQFQSVDTRIANTQMETLQGTIERIRVRLEAQGYVRAPN